MNNIRLDIHTVIQKEIAIGFTIAHIMGAYMRIITGEETLDARVSNIANTENSSLMTERRKEFFKTLLLELVDKNVESEQVYQTLYDRVKAWIEIEMESPLGSLAMPGKN